MPALPPIDFARIKSESDLSSIIGNELGWNSSNGKYRCPFHDESTGSFVVYEDQFHCFGCREHGDVFDWFRLRHGMTTVQAAKFLDPSLEIIQDRPGRTERRSVGQPVVISQKPHLGTVRPVPGNRPVVPEPDNPVEIWQTTDYQRKLEALVQGGIDRLWSPEGLDALGWLRLRGLTDDTIRRFRLGFFPDNHVTDPVEGLANRDGMPSKLRAVRGVTIPWPAPGVWRKPSEPAYEGPRWVGMNVRRLADPVDAPLVVGDDDKCRAVRGSKRGFLYPFPDLRPTTKPLPVLLCEGEFDALIGHQLVGHMVHVVTAGGAGVNPRNLPTETRAALARCPWIYLAFDMDEAGAKAAWEWRESFPHKSRRVLLPHSKDLNDFVKAGGDLVAWVASILNQSVPAAPPLPPASVAPVVARSPAWWSAVRSLGDGPGDAWEPLSGSLSEFQSVELDDI